MIREFNPDKHSLWHAAEKVLSLDPRVDIAIRTLAEEYGFRLPADDLLVEDFQELVRLDRDGSERMWSTYRTFEDAELEYEIDLPTPTRIGPPYEIIYADPGWQFRNKKTGGSHKSGAVQQYTVSSQETLCALPISTLADNNCALFLWATVPMLPEALEVLDAWGFKFKTALFWNKERYGLGWWFRGQVEILMLGIKGKVKAFRCQERNINHQKSEGHSRKPTYYRDLIVQATTGILDGPRIELFSRDVDLPGWDYWGNETYTDIRLTRSGKWLRKREGRTQTMQTRTRTNDSIVT